MHHLGIDKEQSWPFKGTAPETSCEVQFFGKGKGTIFAHYFLTVWRVILAPTPFKHI